MNAIGNFVKHEREKRGWTQGDLERNSGVSQGSVSRIEQGKQTAVIVKIFETFGFQEVSFPIGEPGVPYKFKIDEDIDSKQFKKIQTALQTLPSDLQRKIYYDLMGNMLKIISELELDQNTIEILNNGIQALSSLINKKFNESKEAIK